MAKLPSFQFYPGDWLKDPDLRVCSTLARGLLIDLLCFCFESDRRGYLVKRNSTPWSTHDAFCAAGSDMSFDEFKACWDELHDNKVLKIEESTGCSYSARMVRDEEIREIRSSAGKKGGNPNFGKGNGNPYYNQTDKQKHKQTAKQKITPSSSSSSSSSECTNTPIPPPGEKCTDGQIDTEFDSQFWPAWPKKVGIDRARRAYHKARKRSDAPTLEDLLTGVETAKRLDARFRERKYIPHASTWLNSGGWTDEHDPTDRGQHEQPRSAADRAARQAQADREIIERALARGDIH